MRYGGRQLLLLAGFALLTLAAAAAAQVPHLATHELALTVEPPTSPITPVTDVIEIPATLSVGCEGVHTHVTQDPIELSVDVDQHWAAVSLDRELVFIEFGPEECAVGTTVEETFTITAAVSHKARAGEVATITVHARTANGDETTTTFDVTAGSFARWEARFDRAEIDTEAGSTVMFPARITNHGNGPLHVTFALGQGSSAMLLVTVPGPQLLDASGGEGNSEMVVPVDVRAAEASGRADSFVLALSATMDGGATEVQGLHLDGMVRTTGPALRSIAELSTTSMGVVLLATLAFAVGRRR